MAATKVVLLNRLAADIQRERHSEYQASQTHARPQARDSNTNGNPEKGGQKYESNMRRLYKYFSEWKTQSGSSSPQQPPSFSIFSGKIRTLVKRTKSTDSVVSVNNEKGKMGVALSTEEINTSTAEGKTPYLPLELQIQILKNLTWKEQVRLASVCRTWRSVVIDWVVPQNFRSLSGDTVLGPYVINPLLEEVRCELGSSVLAAESLYTGNGESVLDQPLCFPPSSHILVKISDLRNDSLEPAVDETIHVFSTRCCDRYIRIRDVLAAMDKFYRQVNEDRVIGDYKSWRSWKFLLETNRWWRRGYVGLCGKWEWRDGGRTLCFFAEKVEGAWENDFKN
ncbi:hypothetical protein H072_3375 [Dactylellina haptotyla CBS 200.50]|uniref:F-box domain-containing protein n=1 Tax=Dactylellina haptotyla (strain CBS 200.50) TaxID=1284197 RepID=S8BSX5_DACHA|nr:hypothetical protein H072_3375 [Dactylellina haptotyla CBS 200.50]